MDEIREACGAAGAWKAAVVGLGHPGGWEATFFEKPFWMIDLPIAFSHMTLMAASLHCLTKLRMDDIDEEEISRMLKVPPKMRTGGVLGIF